MIHYQKKTKRPYLKKAHKLLSEVVEVGACDCLQWSQCRIHANLNDGAAVPATDAAAASCGSHVVLLH